MDEQEIKKPKKGKKKAAPKVNMVGAEDQLVAGIGAETADEVYAELKKVEEAEPTPAAETVKTNRGNLRSEGGKSRSKTPQRPAPKTRVKLTSGYIREDR